MASTVAHWLVRLHDEAGRVKCLGTQNLEANKAFAFRFTRLDDAQACAAYYRKRGFDARVVRARTTTKARRVEDAEARLDRVRAALAGDRPDAEIVAAVRAALEAP